MFRGAAGGKGGGMVQVAVETKAPVPATRSKSIGPADNTTWMNTAVFWKKSKASTDYDRPRQAAVAGNRWELAPQSFESFNAQGVDGTERGEAPSTPTRRGKKKSCYAEGLFAQLTVSRNAHGRGGRASRTKCTRGNRSNRPVASDANQQKSCGRAQTPGPTVCS